MARVELSFKELEKWVTGEGKMQRPFSFGGFPGRLEHFSRHSGVLKQRKDGGF